MKEHTAETGASYGDEMSSERLGGLVRDWQPLFARYGICSETIDGFKSIISHHYRHYGRQFSWRSEISPYRVLVSEIMLQQTQTSRVEQKFEDFVQKFAGFDELARAPFSEVLAVWKGLGYNRRARYLQDIAVQVVDRNAGELANDPEALRRLPGIGSATAASICVFAFNKPYPFVETNIRTVFIHFFFPNQDKVGDPAILELVEKTIEPAEPRSWFYALMDYGVMLKKTVGNLNRLSTQYTRQSRFEGSDRQLRGRILQALLEKNGRSAPELAQLLGEPVERISILAGSLIRDGLISEHQGLLVLQ